ncbi:hypothetical protein EX30DRAFT_374503 [Ascodesmis nigricans]|uniref:Uncharacterized protein n=1 Tax=Ascodesmis nigricans TaxID=341454 RepID=A0A4S2MKT1_9PEZI|nr:hypothetical protein EX30DRAFT_374503 [Ascodesmis nigricans]
MTSTLLRAIPRIAKQQIRTVYEAAPKSATSQIAAAASTQRYVPPPQTYERNYCEDTLPERIRELKSHTPIAPSTTSRPRQRIRINITNDQLPQSVLHSLASRGDSPDMRYLMPEKHEDRLEVGLEEGVEPGDTVGTEPAPEMGVEEKGDKGEREEWEEWEEGVEPGETTGTEPDWGVYGGKK